MGSRTRVLANRLDHVIDNDGLQLRGCHEKFRPCVISGINFSRGVCCHLRPYINLKQLRSLYYISST